MIDVLLLAVVSATPLVLAVEGETVVQRAGIINLGIEGMMLNGAMTAVLFAQWSHSASVAFAGGVLGAALTAAVFGFFTIVLAADQIVTGTAINLFALGLTGFVYREMTPLFVESVPRIRYDVIVPIAWIVVPLALALLLWKTTFGLRLRACGENPAAVAASCASVRAIRWTALGIESVLTGIAGAYLALALSSGFAENMTAGRGYIALSIVIFGRWKFKGAVLGTALFGLAAAAQYALQAANRGVQFHLLLAVPYVVTLLILCGIAGRVVAPEALGKRG